MSSALFCAVSCWREIRVVGANGFEPSTSWSRNGRSKNLKPCGCCTYKPHHPKNPASVGPQMVHKPPSSTPWRNAERVPEVHEKGAQTGDETLCGAQVGSTLAAAIGAAKWMFDEQRFGNDGTESSRPCRSD